MNEALFDYDLFAELYDIQPQGIAWMKAVWNDDHSAVIDFQFVYSNQGGLNYLNLTAAEFKTLRLSNTPTLSNELRKNIMEEMIGVYQTGQPSITNFYNPVLNKYARLLRTKLRDGVLTIVEDRTEENRIIKQLETKTSELEEKTTQLEEQKNLLNNILQNSSNGISVSKVFRDDNGRVVDALTILANDAAVKYIGLPKDIYLTKRATEIEPNIIGSPYYQACIKTLETGEAFMMQYQMQANGRWLELTVSRLDYMHLIQIFTDVTPIKEAQLKLERLVEELQGSNAKLEEFAHAASHDLKEPIRKIHVFSDRLQSSLSQRMNETEKDLFQRMQNATQRMALLVDDLLAYSQVSLTPVAKEEVDLNKKIGLVLTDLELFIQEKKATIDVGPLPVVKGYRRQLQQLFQNLIANALKYSKSNVAPHLIIRSGKVTGADFPDRVPAERAGQVYHLLDVRDNGIGFEPEQAELIFQLFHRLHGKSEYTGTGIGLALVRKVVDNHQGYVWAEGEPGAGANFRVLLPA